MSNQSNVKKMRVCVFCRQDIDSLRRANFRAQHYIPCKASNHEKGWHKYELASGSRLCRICRDISTKKSQLKNAEKIKERDRLRRRTNV